MDRDLISLLFAYDYRSNVPATAKRKKSTSRSSGSRSRSASPVGDKVIIDSKLSRVQHHNNEDLSKWKAFADGKFSVTLYHDICL